jgi:hypothetical protein
MSAEVIRLADSLAGLPSVDGAQGAADPTSGPEPGWEPQLPAPEPLPDRERIRHPQLGVPSAVYPSHDEKGRLLSATCRFELGEGKKCVLPYTYGKLAGGTLGWQFKAPPAPRPLFGLDALAARPDAEVLVVEGEKPALKARDRFPDHAVVTSLGGARSAKESD